ncbi:MAG: hypothetical protein IT430_09975 [Phycisphaerales bacterium]|nr:hypothetical protein [Phycisphaerales bacterium]
MHTTLRTRLKLVILTVMAVGAGGYGVLRAQSPAAAESASGGGPAIEAIDQVRLPLTDIKAERGLCYVARIPLLAPNERDDRQTGLRLFEDGVPLPLAHARFEEIGTIGRGRYLHLGPRVWFSTTDNSDPRENGRRSCRLRRWTRGCCRARM